jgi:hypothetical protein
MDVSWPNLWKYGCYVHITRRTNWHSSDYPSCKVLWCTIWVRSVDTLCMVYDDCTKLILRKPMHGCNRLSCCRPITHILQLSSLCSLFLYKFSWANRRMYAMDCLSAALQLRHCAAYLALFLFRFTRYPEQMHVWIQWTVLMFPNMPDTLCGFPLLCSSSGSWGYHICYTITRVQKTNMCI